jgi:predicted DNA-binding transcriptional regulator AlpA
LNRYHPILNKKQFAESCGMTREQLYKYLPKTTNSEVTPKKSENADK